jgi:hypothetical protein
LLNPAAGQVLNAGERQCDAVLKLFVAISVKTLAPGLHLRIPSLSKRFREALR